MYRYRRIFSSISYEIESNWSILRFKTDGKGRFILKWKIMRSDKLEEYNGVFKK